MNAQISRFGGIVCLLVMIFFATSCDKEAKPTEKAPEPASTSTTSAPAPKKDVENTAKPAPLSKLEGDSHKRAGKYCFEYKEGNLSLRCELKLDENENVNGFMKGLVTHADNSKMPYDVTFNGSKKGSELTVKVIGDQNGSTEERVETWQWAGKHLQDLKHRLNESACG